MPLYSDPGYSYYSSSSGGNLYSPYYNSPLYSSSSTSSSSPYAPYSSTYNRSFGGTYSLPSTSRSARYTTMVSSYQPKLTTITESPLNRSNFIPLTRIKSPKLTSYTSSISTAYIPTPRTARFKTINTADIDVSASSRYGKHHHMEDRKDDVEKSDPVETETAASSTTDSDTNSTVVDPNSPYMPRIDGSDTASTARSTIKRNRAVVRLSTMRPRNKQSPKIDDNTIVDQKDKPKPNTQPPEISFIQDRVPEQSTQMCVTDMVQSQCSETSLNEVIIEVDPITNTVRRLSIPPPPTFHDICEDISSDKIDDDLNAGELRRRASLIQEQEMEIINEVQKSQSGSFQVIHLERNLSQEDCRKSRKSKKVKKLRHKITANVEIINPPLTPVIQQTIEEEIQASLSPVAKPRFTFNIEEIEEHKVFKLPKKKIKSVKAKKINEEKVEEKVEEKIKESDSKQSKTQNNQKTSKPSIEISSVNEAPKISSETSTDAKKNKEEPIEKIATPKPIRKNIKTEDDDDFWSQIGTRETLYMNKRKKIVEKNQTLIENTSEHHKTEILLSVQTEASKILQVDDQGMSSGTSSAFKTTDLRKNESFVSDLKKTNETLLQKTAETVKKPLNFDKKEPPKSSSDKLLQKDLTNKISETKPNTSNLSKSEQRISPKKQISNPKIIAESSQIDKIPTESPRDSIKTKNAPKTSSKKKSSPKNCAKVETSVDPNAQLKPESTVSTPTTTTTTSPEANPTKSGTLAKSIDKRKSVKTDKSTTKQSITKSVSLIEVTSNASHKEVSDSKQLIKESPSTPVTPTFLRKSTKLTAFKSDLKSSEETKTNQYENKQEKNSKQPENLETNPNSTSSSVLTSSANGNATKLLETQNVKQSVATPDVSVAQVLLQTTTSTNTTSTSTSTTEFSSQSIASDKPTTTTTTTKETTSTDRNNTVLGSGNNNLSKFATVSNLAHYLLDVDADLEDYIPSSAEESDSSSDSYSGDGSLSASMKKKNKQLKKKAKEAAQPAFDPNKKIKIDTKKKCYVKEEAPRYPLVATPRPLWKREKVVYEESSNSSSEETESESECTTSDEYEDELCPKDAIIRMSTCSNDSGFDGGTTPSSPKKILETSYTYLQFQKTGRITAPATTIPRFKKYSVEDFNFLAVLGKGSFGKVLLAELRNTDFYYAVKCLKKDVVLEDDDVECTLIERKVLALGTKHPYLCHLFCTFQTESHLFFVMEYLNGGDLMFHIQESGRFPEERARFYGAEIISGLKFLHKKGIIYRDLKLDNVLLDFDGHVRIADFGMCKLQIYLDKTADSFCGTPDYMAPEIIKGDKYNQNVDWWSFGVLLYEMLIGQSPFSGCDEDELFWSICNEIPWFPVYITQEATSILKGLLEKDYTKRVGSQYSPAGDICDHIFFSSIDWGLLEKRQLPPPFKPQVKHPLDTQYFEKIFTRERVRLTPIDKEILQSMDQEQFQGFSYTNPNATLD